MKYLDAHRITTNLWMGAAPVTPEQRREVSQNFDVLVLCAEEFQPRTGFSRSLEIIRCGIDDADLTRRERRKVFDAALYTAGHIAGGNFRVLVTCWQGRNRSGIVVAGALIFLGHSPAEAIAMVRARRRVSYVLSNSDFTRHLRGEFLREVESLMGMPHPR